MTSSSEQSISEEDEPLAHNHPRFAWRSLFHFTTRSHYVVLILASVFAILSSVILPAFAYFLGKSFNAFTSYGAARISTEEFLDQIAQQASYMAVLGAINLVLSAFFLFFWLLFGEVQTTGTCRYLFSSMSNKDMEWFDMHKHGISALLLRVQSQLHELRLATSQPLGFLCQYSCTILAAIGLAFYSAWDLTLVVIASAPIGAVFLMFLSTRLQIHIKQHAAHLKVSVKHATAAINAISTVQCANGQEFELQQYTKSIRRAGIEYKSLARLNAIQFGFVRFLTFAIFVQGFWYGNHLVSNRSREPAQILTAFWSCLIATQTFEGLLQHLLVLGKGCAAGELLHSMLTSNNQIRRLNRAQLTPDHCEGDIQFEKVSFAYPSAPEVLVLDEATMFFTARETTFIVGKSGSGKSTLSNLLLGFYSASGKLTIDGKLIESLDRDWLRNNITVMQQQSVLFNESILRNIAFGIREFECVGPKDIEKCIKSAALSDTIVSLPKGVHTIVGTSGNLMSGGQRQRISFARARLRDTPVLIFDEATSALDREAADVIMQSIRQWRRNKTTIIITHDLSQVLEDDYVYVMDCGKIVQEGYKATLEKVNYRGFRELAGPQHHLFKALPNIPIQLASQPLSCSSNISSSSEYLPPRASNSVGTTVDHHRKTITNPWTSFETASKSSGQVRISLARGQEYKRLSTELSNRHFLVPAYSKVALPAQDSILGLQSDRRNIDLAQVKSNEQSQEDQSVHSDTQQHHPSKTGQAYSFFKILSTIWPNLGRKQRICLMLGLLAAIGHAVATPLFSWAFSKLIGTYASNMTGSSQASLQWSLAVLVVAVGDGMLSFSMHYFLEIVAQDWVDALRLKAYQRILYQPRFWFDGEEQNTQRLIGCLDKSGEETRNLLGRFLSLLITAAIMIVVAVIWSLILCWKLTLVCLACGPLIYTLTGVFDSVNARWESKYNSVTQSIAESFTETFGNIFTVRALTLENYFHYKNTVLTRQALIVGVKRAIYSGIFFGTSDTAILLIIALLFWYSSQLIAYYSVSIEVILTVLSMLLFTLTSIVSMISIIPQFNTSQDMASQLLSVVNLERRPFQEYTCVHKPFKLDGSIVISNLSFVYPSRPQQVAMRALSLVIPLGSSTAIIGPSGSGKTTLISLLLGLYAPVPSTAIRIASYILSEIDITILRRFVALSPQNPPIFPTSIKANIAYALPISSSLSSIDNIITAARLAGIHSFISSLPGGYDTIIGEGGSLLSGGQIARIGLARAICRQPKILILDEPTAGLDGLARTELINVIQNLVQGGVSVIIATHDTALQGACQHVIELSL